MLIGLTLVALAVLGFSAKPWNIPPAWDEIARYAAIYSWWAGLLTCLGLFALAATTRWWLRPLPPDFTASAPAPLSRGVRGMILGAMIVAAGLGAVRMNDSLWHDEEYSVRHAILGTSKIKDDQVVKLRELPWTQTFWYYNKPTNHILQSVVSRLSLSAWRMVARPNGLQINEPAVRLPSYLAGILSIGAIAWLLARAGLPWAGVLAAWLLAVHPWYLKLAPEARGYAFVFLFMPLIALLAIRALETGRWRWWLALSFTEFLLVWTWPPALVAALVLNLGLAAKILAGSSSLQTRMTLAARWLVGGLLTTLLLFQLMLPCLPQFQDYAATSQGFVFHNIWLKNVGSLLFFGAYWTKTGRTDASPYWEMLPQAAAHPALVPAALLIMASLLVLGATTLGRQAPHGRWLALFILLPGPLLFLISYYRQQYMFEWYLSFMLPGLIALVAAGIYRIGQALPKPFVPAAIMVAAFAAFTWLTWENRDFLITKPAQQYRESVLLTRPQLDPNALENLTILTASSMLMPDVYDPRVRKVKTLDDYAALMQIADEKGMPFFVNNGFPDILKDQQPDIHALLSDPEIFELIARLPANEPLLDRVIHKYRPGSLKGADLSRYRTSAKVQD